MKIQTLDTYKISCMIALLSKAQPNTCFTNAYEALDMLSELINSYVEGWIVIDTPSEIQVIEHGWCTLNDKLGRVVDPSIVLVAPANEVPIYCPGVEYSREEAKQFHGELLPHVWETHGMGGMQHPDYKAAYDAAQEIAAARSREYHPAKKITLLEAREEE